MKIVAKEVFINQNGTLKGNCFIKFSMITEMVFCWWILSLKDSWSWGNSCSVWGKEEGKLMIPQRVHFSKTFKLPQRIVFQDTSTLWCYLALLWTHCPSICTVLYAPESPRLSLAWSITCKSLNPCMF